MLSPLSSPQCRQLLQLVEKRWKWCVPLARSWCRYLLYATELLLTIMHRKSKGKNRMTTSHELQTMMCTKKEINAPIVLELNCLGSTAVLFWQSARSDRRSERLLRSQTKPDRTILMEHLTNNKEIPFVIQSYFALQMLGNRSDSTVSSRSCEPTTFKTHTKRHNVVIKYSK